MPQAMNSSGSNLVQCKITLTQHSGLNNSFLGRNRTKNKTIRKLDIFKTKVFGKYSKYSIGFCLHVIYQNSCPFTNTVS